MNTQELIEKYAYLNHGCFRRVDTSEVLKDLKQLDKPQKVTVPQFVADWYEEHKDDFEFNVWDWVSSKDEPEKIHSEFAFWVNDVENNPIQTLVNMHQFGYEVEKEKRYLVKAKGMDADFVVLKLDKIRDSWYLGNDTEYSYTKVKHTRKELEDAGFGDVFDSPLFEIEEVEE